MINKKTFIISLVFFCLALLLRIYDLPNRYIFTFDEEYQATYGWTQVLDPHPIWIGVSASFLDYYMGPLFTYFTAILLAISSGDPLITAYVAAITGSLTAVVIFLIGWKFFNLFTGTLAALLYATLPLFVFYDQKYWNPMFAPLITLLMFVTLNLISKNKWWWVGFAGLIGLIFETELAPAPLILIGIWYFFKKKFWKDVKLLLFCILTFIVFYWPLIVFDVNHNFSNLKVFTRLYSQINKSEVKFDPLVKFQSFFDSLGRFWYLKPGNSNADEINISCSVYTVKQEFKFIKDFAKRTYSPIWISVISITGILYFLWFAFKNKNKSTKLLSIFILTLLVSFFIYPGAAFEYHNLGLFALLTFIPGILISKLSTKKRVIPSTLLIFVILTGLNTVLKVSDEFGLGPKKKLISEIMNQIGERSFAIEGRGICHNFEGWRYLFKVYGRTPSISYTDKNFGWLYSDEIGKNPAYTIILSEDRIPKEADLFSYPSIKEGGFRAYIKKN